MPRWAEGGPDLLAGRAMHWARCPQGSQVQVEGCVVSRCTDLFPHKEPLLSICHLGDALTAHSEIMGPSGFLRPSSSFHFLV